MIKMGEKEKQEFEQKWNEARECFFLIRLKKAKIVVVRERSGREYRYTKPLLEEKS
ncbi:MAG: hypothetical protein NC123_18910 [Butyrivibrio sp.]|nr:hypothetical protein [Acetatifactor muris]MCM1561583.1 hypothetical protein [Butyrivibrio sp.]